jgi:hypothetical protein
MFSKAAEKKKDEPAAEKKSPEEKKEPESKGKGKMGALSFFGKSSAAKKSSEPVKETKSAGNKHDDKKDKEKATTAKGKKTIRVESGL